MFSWNVHAFLKPEMPGVWKWQAFLETGNKKNISFFFPPKIDFLTNLSHVLHFTLLKNSLSKVPVVVST